MIVMSLNLMTMNSVFICIIFASDLDIEVSIFITLI